MIDIEANVIKSTVDTASDLQTVGFAICITIVILALLIKTPRMKLPVQGIPMAPYSHWFFGHSLVLIGDFKQAYPKIAYENADQDGFCSFWDLTNKPAITVNTIEKARMIFTISSSKPALGIMRKHTLPLLGKTGLPFLNGKHWRHQRNLYGKALSKKAVECMLDPVRDITKSLTLALSDKIKHDNEGCKSIVMNMEVIFQLLLADIASKIFFGMDCKCCENLKQSPITKSVNFLLSEIGRRITSPLNPAAQIYSLPTFLNRKYQENVKFIRATLKDVIQERHKILLNSTVTTTKKGHSDFITSLLEGRESLDQRTIDEVIDSMCTSYMASFDSSTSTLQSIFYCLASHSEVERKCMEEVKKLLDEGSNSLDPDRLVYCNAVVMETLRLYPAFVAMHRTLEKPLKLKNTTVPAGVNAIIPIWHIQRDERHFPRALEFLPERWVRRDEDGFWVNRDAKEEALSNNSKNVDKFESKSSFSSDESSIPGSDPDNVEIMAKCDDNYIASSLDQNYEEFIPAGNNEAFLAFSAGGRACPGYKLANMEFTVILVELLRNFKFELTQGFKIEPRNIALSQKQFGGIPMIITKRD